jgi:hypothetical protein
MRNFASSKTSCIDSFLNQVVRPQLQSSVRSKGQCARINSEKIEAASNGRQRIEGGFVKIKGIQIIISFATPKTNPLWKPVD